MKSAVVDRQSATIKIVKDGQVVRELPFRILSVDAVIVGGRLFSAPTADLHKWSEENQNGSRRRHEDDGWLMREGDKPTFPDILPGKACRFGPRPEFFREASALGSRRISGEAARFRRWAPLGPKQAIVREIEDSRTKLKELKVKIAKVRNPVVRQELRAEAEEIKRQLERKEDTLQSDAFKVSLRRLHGRKKGGSHRRKRFAGGAPVGNEPAEKAGGKNKKKFKKRGGKKKGGDGNEQKGGKGKSRQKK